MSFIPDVQLGIDAVFSETIIPELPNLLDVDLLSGFDNSFDGAFVDISSLEASLAEGRIELSRIELPELEASASIDSFTGRPDIEDAISLGLNQAFEVDPLLGTQPISIVELDIEFTDGVTPQEFSDNGIETFEDLFGDVGFLNGFKLEDLDQSAADDFADFFNSDEINQPEVADFFEEIRDTGSYKVKLETSLVVDVPQITNRIQPSYLDDYLRTFRPFVTGVTSPLEGFPDNLSDIASTLVPPDLNIENPLFVDSRLFNLDNFLDLRDFGENISDAAIDKIRWEIQRVKSNLVDFAAGFTVSLDENLTFGLADKYLGTFFPEFQIDKEALESSLSAQVGELTADVVGLVTGTSEFIQGTIIGVGGSTTLVAVPVGAAKAGYGILLVRQSAIALAENVDDVAELLGRQVLLTSGSESFEPFNPDSGIGNDDGIRQGLDVPQGLSDSQFSDVSNIVRARATDLGLGDDIIVQGSRAGGTAKPTSDIDFAIRLPRKKFDDFLNNGSRLASPNPGSALERTRLRAIETGKIQAGEARLSNLRRELERILGIEVDLSIIRAGGKFDRGPQTPLK